MNPEYIALKQLMSDMLDRMGAVANGNTRYSDPEAWPDEETFVAEFGYFQRRFKELTK